MTTSGGYVYVHTNEVARLRVHISPENYRKKDGDDLQKQVEMHLSSSRRIVRSHIYAGHTS